MLTKSSRLLLAWVITGSVMTLTGCGSSSSSHHSDPQPDTPEPSQPSPEPEPSPEPSPEPEEDSFTMAVMPDTQEYSRYSPERYYAQTQWIANNYQQENIKFTVHLGDIVDIPDDVNEWNVAATAMGYLEANPATPYSILAGNHDVMNSGQYDDARNNSVERYLTYFGPERQKSIFPDNFGGYQQGTDADGRNAPFNTYYTFSDDDGQEYLVLALDWNPSYCDPSWDCAGQYYHLTLEWVKRVLDAHPNTPTILTTHQLMNIDEDGETAIFTDKGTLLWNHIIRDYDQVFLTINGHHHGEAVMEAKNAYGHKVVLEVVDYQSSFWGGDGMMQLIKFNKTNKSLDFRSYSPYVDSLPEAERTDDEEVSRWEYSIAMDFDKRFSEIGQTADDRSGVVEGTRAYWKLDNDHMIGSELDGFRDVSGNANTMNIESGGNAAGGKVSDYMTLVTDEKPPFGYANGYVHFDGSRDNGGFYFTSNAGNITTENTTTGSQLSGYMSNYTVEAVFRMPEDWTSERSRWESIFSNVATISQVCAHHGLNCSGGDSVSTVGISNLREIQWISVSQNGKGGDNWSYALDRGEWYHVAITNDGAKVQMYVNGALVMRSGLDEQQGMLIDKTHNGWNLGAPRYYGDIAEVRVTDRVLQPEEWLYNHEND